MDHDEKPLTQYSGHIQVRNDVSAINARFVAHADHGDVFVRSLSAKNTPFRCIHSGNSRMGMNAMLLFAPNRPDLLAFVSNAQVIIFDVGKQLPRCTIKGTGRVISSFAFSCHDSDIVSTGSIDGTLCIWSLKFAFRPKQCLQELHRPCSFIAYHPEDTDIIAAAHGNRIIVWSVSTRQQVHMIRLDNTGLIYLDWTQSERSFLVCGLSDGSICSWDMESVLLTSKVCVDPHLGADEYFRMPQGGQHLVPARSVYSLGFEVESMRSVSRAVLAVKARETSLLRVYMFKPLARDLHELWSTPIENHELNSIAFRSKRGIHEMLLCTGSRVRHHDVPEALAASFTNVGDEDFTPSERVDNSKRSMKPEGMISTTLGSGSYIFQNARSRRRAQSARDTRKQHVKKTRRPTSQSRSLISITDTARLDGDDSHSLMPFLSPSIPARKTSPSILTSLDESLQLPDPKISIFDPQHAGATQDSDSDDDTLAAHMKDKNDVLSSEVNVPLPRTCGAIFCANGQLITFFPSWAKPQSHAEDKLDDAVGLPQYQTAVVAALFPRFGNSNVTAKILMPELDSVESSRADFTKAPRLVIQTSSLSSHRSWPTKSSPVKGVDPVFSEQHRITVSVHEVDSNSAARKDLAHRYSLVAQDEVTRSRMCEANSVSAEEHGLKDTAEIWQLLAAISDTPTAESIRHAENLTMSIKKKDQSLGLMGSFAQHAGHPFSSSWATNRIFAWAEKEADSQLLACISAPFEMKAPGHTNNAAQYPQSQPSNLISSISDNVVSRSDSAIAKDRPSVVGSTTGDGPSSLSPRSAVKDRMRPPAPLQNDGNSRLLTPGMPALSRQGTQPSFSGSASPERSRTSFGIAAKNYAQSITERFSGFEASPPFRKMSSSPGNEFSSSLPNVSSSWSKLVSLTSMTEADTASRHSLSTTPDDGRLHRTPSFAAHMSNSGLPHSFSGVRVTWRDDSGTSRAYDPEPQSPIIEADLATKGHVWRQFYGQWLRSAGLELTATEIEKITHHQEASAHNAQLQHVGLCVVPQAAKGRGPAICSVCSCAVPAAEQLCPSCLHIMHPECLANLLQSIAAADFTCPTGCGCNCVSTESMDMHVEMEQPALEPTRQTANVLRKKKSITDPRYLRVRLQGDSW